MTADRTKQRQAADTKARENSVDWTVKSKGSLVFRIFGDRARLRARDLEVVEIESGTPKQVNAEQPQRATTTGGRTPLALLSFFGFVVLPFLASVLYYAFIASDQYIAEARFAVRSLAENRGDDGTDSGVLSMSTMSQDGYVVTSFIHSSEILNRISEKLDYRRVFSRPDADFLSRFDEDDSNEEFLQYWENQVTTYVDGPSGIITLKTRTFSPEDSRKLASLILEESEKLINQLSERAQRDMTVRFASEVERTTESYREALAALNDFQNATGLLTPEAQATEKGTLLTGLLARKLELDTRLFVLKESSAQASPTHQQLVLNSKKVESQIDALRKELAGNSTIDANLANALKTFSYLETDRRVAESLYESARKNLETARAEAMRKALYLVVFVPPRSPEESLFPHRVATPLLLLLALAISWLTGALIWASVEDHRL